MKARQKEIGKLGTRDHLAIVERPCNFTMECDKCQRRQKNRAFCYFCSAVQVETTTPASLLLLPSVCRCVPSVASRSAWLRGTVLSSIQVLSS